MRRLIVALVFSFTAGMIDMIRPRSRVVEVWRHTGRLTGTAAPPPPGHRHKWMTR
jgi:hypothetical protein